MRRQKPGKRDVLGGKADEGKELNPPRDLDDIRTLTLTRVVSFADGRMWPLALCMFSPLRR